MNPVIPRDKVLEGLVFLDGADFPTYYSRGAKTRAERLSTIAAHSVDFIREFFTAQIQTKLLILTEEDWTQRIEAPYGLICGQDNFVWYPVCTEDNPVYLAMMPYYENSPFSLSKTLAGLLPDSEAPFLTACVIWWDTYLAHEMFHNYSLADGVQIRLRWFDELFGDYINYAYLRRYAHLYPTELKVSEILFELIYQGGRLLARHTSLKDFEELYTGVGAANYAWYHGWFNMGVFELYELFGEYFISQVIELYKSESGFDGTGKTLATRLEGVCPGFRNWYLAWKQQK